MKKLFLIIVIAIGSIGSSYAWVGQISSKTVKYDIRPKYTNSTVYINAPQIYASVYARNIALAQVRVYGSGGTDYESALAHFGISKSYERYMSPPSGNVSEIWMETAATGWNNSYNVYHSASARWGW